MRCLRLLLVLAICIVATVTDLPAQRVDSTEYRTVEVNGISMAYREFGAGKPLLLLHGNGNSGRMWDPLVPQLSAHYRLIIPDLRGYGRSTNPTGEFTFRQAALDLLALLDTLKIERFRAVGNSGGAMTLLHVATRQPDRVEAMVLQAGTSYFPEHLREWARADSPDRWTQEELEEMVRNEIAMDVDQARAVRGYRRAVILRGDMAFTEVSLSTITARTLIIHGDRDPYFPVDIAVEQYRSIPHAYLWIRPNHGHYVGFPVEVWLEFFSGGWWNGNSR